MLGIRLPSISLSSLKDKWVLGGLALGAALYFMTTKTMTGIGPLDRVLVETGNLTHIEGVFVNQTPTNWVHTPGKTTVLHHTPKSATIGAQTLHPAGQNIGEYETGGPLMRFSGQAELQRRLTLT